jgi:Family of unknown function (DUF5686)/CarboxypepD_reg-like domain
MQRIFCLLFLFFCSIYVCQSQIAKGIIKDAKTQKPLAFVSVIDSKTGKGVATDIDGKFELQNIAINSIIVFKYLGYTSQQIKFLQQTNIEVFLVANNSQLVDVVVSSSDNNPANRIIKLLHQNKQFNNPELYNYFSYTAYTKSGMAFNDSTFNKSRNSETRKLTKADSLLIYKIKTDSAFREKIAKEQAKYKQTSQDSLLSFLGKRLEENYIFLSESYTSRIFSKNVGSNEVIIANRITGFKDPVFSLVSENFQPFGFYKNYLQMNGTDFLSPLINTSIQFYKFKLIDEIVNGLDTTFVINFYPKKNSNFIGLQGTICINSHKYAIENIIAKPANDNGYFLTFKLQQAYKLIEDSNKNSNWFPSQLNTTLYFKERDSSANDIYWDAKTYITNIEINKKIAAKNFSNLSLDYLPTATKKSEDDWKKLRADTLSKKEATTDSVYKQMPKIVLNNMEIVNKVVEVAALEALPWGKIDLPFKYLLSGINKYENFRLGAGFTTNSTFNKWFRFGGYLGYGFGDKSFKYGGNASLILNERTNTSINFSYKQDIEEPGNVNFFDNNGSIFSPKSLRNFFVNKMDSIKQYKAWFCYNPLPWIETQVWLQNQKIGFANYGYSFTNNDKNLQSIQNIEIGLGFRFAKGEKFMKIGRAKVVNIPANTQLLVSISTSISENKPNNFNFLKIATQLKTKIKLNRLGNSIVTSEFGYIDGSVPYHYLFNITGVNAKNNNLYIANGFQTVGLNEFAASTYGAIYWQHTFGGTIFNSKNRFFKPQLSIVNNMAMGTINNINQHINAGFSTLKNLLVESGIYINNIYRKEYLGLYYIGIDAGIFYRYGALALPKFGDNFTYKIGLSFSIN